MKPAVLVGLMSGTSLDGISAAVVRFTPQGERVRFDLLAHGSTVYTPEQRARLATALTSATPSDYCTLNFDVGEWLAAAAAAVLAESGVARADIAAVASHGQTVWHEARHSTWQLGEAAVIAERLGRPVISDFRVRDMAAGGEGAPLVPIADAMLFSSDSSWRALQNIGGIGNVSVIPPRGELSGVRAFDTGPGVVVIDSVVRRLRPDLPYDVDGLLGAAGRPSERVVQELLGNPFFAAEPPKSTGRELFTSDYMERFIWRCREEGAADEDIVATAALLTARSIAEAYSRFVAEPVSEVLVSGGGARNPTLVSMLERELAPRRLVVFDEEYFDAEAKEAVAFALLGYLHLMGMPGNIPRATGARGPRVLGKYSPA
jgi:anhydro-N-acetylmuramic acid kinase